MLWLSGCEGTSTVPEPQEKWLSRKQTNISFTTDYLRAVGGIPGEVCSSGQCKQTFYQWTSANGFDEGGVITAYYYNEQDLRLGREMHCKQKEMNLACYVHNYGQPGGSAEDAFAEMHAGNIIATVAMDRIYLGDGNYDVQFYVFAWNEDYEPPDDSFLLVGAELDSEGLKGYPGVCMACHGGYLNPETNKVENASFLPFDVYSFKYDTAPGRSLAEQQEAFRQLNFMVLSPGNRSVAIQNLINGMYQDMVNVPGTIPIDDFVPLPGSSGLATGWQAYPEMYERVVGPYCRGCHIALNPDFLDYQEFVLYHNSIERDVCQTFVMPHAEVTFNRFWQDFGAKLFLGLSNPDVDPPWPGFSECADQPGSPAPNAATVPPP